MATKLVQDSSLTSIANAIRAKSGTSAQLEFPTDFVSAIQNIPTGGGGGGGSVSDSIKFIDYDGTVLHSYSVSDFMALTAMPANPTHTGLTSQGWNWSLADAKAQLTVYPEAGLTIGQMYITDDGKTRLYVHFEEGRLHPYLGICPNGTVVIDWGDNSVTSTLTGTSLTTTQYANHEYTTPGDYIITLTVSSGSFAFYGGSDSSNTLKKDASTTTYIHRVYANCLQRVEIGASANIGNYAFNNCYSLASITIPDSVTNIGGYAFNFCCSLASITIPNGVTSIEISALQNCYSLISITIPEGVTNIGNSAFSGCYSLTSITIPDGVTSIGNSMVAHCYSLASINIPDDVTNIGGYTFQNCYSLTSITIPSGVTSINTYAFNNCRSFTSITIPDSVTSIETSAFRFCCSLASITIPNGVTSIKAYAFQDCCSLASITIPDSVTSIAASALQNCYSLTSITIPDGVTSIGSSAFVNCYSLVSIIIPDSVTSIGDKAFQGCYGIVEYHFESTTPPTLGTTTFNNIQSDCIIYVPTGSLEAYQTATNWSTYASYIQEESA